MKNYKPLPVESLVVRSYNGGLSTVYTPDQIPAVRAATRKGDYVPTPALYERPRTSEGVEYASIADIATGGTPAVFERGETLSAASCLFPIHDAPNFVRWITPAHKIKIREARERVEAARKELTKAIDRAFEAATPITPEQVRALGTNDPRYK